jgi:outer membrane murein-binding lipoprotein Lpp
MRKHYGNHYRSSASRVSPYTVNCDMDDIDERLDRLEKLVRAHVLEPAEVPVGAAMSVAVAKVERAAKVVKALADEIPAPEPMPGSKAGLREQVAELRSANHTLAQQVDRLSTQLRAEQIDHRSARMEANFAKEDLRRYKIDAETKVRQLATSLSKS